MGNIVCNHCGGHDNSSHKRGFSAGKSLNYALVLGIVGLFAGLTGAAYMAFVGFLSGFVGADKIDTTCLSCNELIDVRAAINAQRRAAGEKPLPMPANTQATIVLGALLLLFIVLTEYFPVN